jgi:SAM-dependent methyltransferase
MIYMADHLTTLLGAFEQSIHTRTLVKLVLGKYRGQDEGLRNIVIKPVTLSHGDRLSFVFRHQAKDVTKNVPVPDGIARVRALLGGDFRSAHLFTTSGNMELVYGKKLKPHLRRSGPTHAEPARREHNRAKTRWVPGSAPYLSALGVTTREGHVKKGMEAKYRQINKFIEIVDHLLVESSLSRADEIRVLDMGSGKGYLTFGLYDYLTSRMGVRATVTGVEARPELVDQCNAIAHDLGFGGLHFECGAIANAPPRPTDVLIALHACNTATDDALFQAVRGEAALVLVAPCCHQEVRPEMKCPGPGLAGIMKHGILKERQAELVTDALRALLLEGCGYRTKVFEFIATEHTSKNLMIAALRSRRPRASALREVAALKEAFGIAHQRLETLLGGVLPVGEQGRPLVVEEGDIGGVHDAED